MTCAVLNNRGRYVAAEKADAPKRIASLQAMGYPLTLAAAKPIPEDYVRMAAYDAKNRLHIFARATDMSWAAPLLSVADRCGIQRAVTVFPLMPGGVPCADVIDRLEMLAGGRPTTFLFMFPRILIPVTKSETACTVGGRSVDPQHVSYIGGGFYPSYAYVSLFMEKVHKYLDCTRHVCGMCGKDCALCAS